MLLSKLGFSPEYILLVINTFKILDKLSKAINQETAIIANPNDLWRILINYELTRDVTDPSLKAVLTFRCFNFTMLDGGDVSFEVTPGTEYTSFPTAELIGSIESIVKITDRLVDDANAVEACITRILSA